MPLRRINNELILVCVNHDDGNHYTSPLRAAVSTITILAGWRALVMAHPETHVAGIGRVPPRIDATLGTPVRAYACTMCGYVETYLAPKVSPGEWPFGSPDNSASTNSARQ